MPSNSRRTVSAPLVISLLALIVALVATPVGQSVAAGLTKGSVKKIAKKVADKEIQKQASSLTVAKAADADKLGGVPSSGFARTGGSQLALGPSAWFGVNAVDDELERAGNIASTPILTLGNHAYGVAVQVPSATNGRKQRLTKLRYCFSVSSGAKLTIESLSAFRYEGSALGAPVGTEIVNAIDAQTPGCRVVSTDLVLGPHDSVTFTVVVNVSVPGAASFGGVNLQLEPTDLPLEPVS